MKKDDKEKLLIEMEDLKEQIKNISPTVAKSLEIGIRELKPSIEHERKVELAESRISGRRSWQDSIPKYVVVNIIIAIVSVVVGYFIGKFM
jgi:SAM-dependent MidA family methyltransferase